jgi:GTP-binding protein HflX
VANQIDRCPAAELERARALEPDALFVSATAGLGLRHLKGELAHWGIPSSAVAAANLAPTSQG